MSAARKPAEGPETPHPRETLELFGHQDAEQAFLGAYKSGRLPHAWLIGGPSGIGKATLAYRMARFVLAHPDPVSDVVQRADTLALDPDDPVARRVTAQGHSDLLVLERTAGDSGALRTVITVDQVRRTIGFFGSTAGEGGWRVLIVDAVDELNAAGTNALLKILEEPPARALLLLVSHAPGRLLPTIRSRCRRLSLRPLTEAEVAQAAAPTLEVDVTDADLRKAAAAADGSVARALMLMGGSALAVREQVNGLLAALPTVDGRALHALGDALGRADDDAFATFVDALKDWLSARLNAESAEPHRLAQVAEVWEKLHRTARDVEIFRLDRKPMVFAVFGLLAETVRR
jgi:DNA polymerase-3 subunit delta'